MEKEKLKSMPKVELHCHLDGSLSQTFISRELGREVDPGGLWMPQSEGVSGKI